MNRIGVCSWSLQPASPAELVERVRACGLALVQLALDPLREGGWDLDATAATLRSADVALASGMMGTRGEDYSTLETIQRTGGVRPDEHWEANRAAAAANAALARRLGLGLVTLHAGFLPEERGDPERDVLLDRLREVVDLFAAEGVNVAFETGQETAGTLLGVLEELDRPRAGVNFDPANMILYDKGDPVDALARLAPWVRQVHVKDARRTRVPGSWGEEVAAGTGDVDWPRFFALLVEHAPAVDLLIEREAGAARIDDIRAAHALVLERLGT